MRLLKRSLTGGFELVSFDDDDAPPYAILSHTWIDGQEVTYNELVAGAAAGQSKTGHDKIRFCMERAIQDGLQYCWVDTCCINKSIPEETQAAINSMFRYYRRAHKCYVYLSDVLVPDEVTDAQTFRTTWEDAFRRSRWFTRGWTLQELLAPPTVEFYSKNRKRLGSKVSLEREIHEITRIPVAALNKQRRLAEFSVEERLLWVAKRTTTLKEDKVYCLLGIFEVFLPLIYGEGEAYAESRLRAEIRRRQEGRSTERVQDLAVFSPLSFPRNELFTGREGELRSLEQFLHSSTHRRMTIYGLGGCGKSALAIEFAYRALAQRPDRLIFWVPAISRESFTLAYQEIGVRLRVPGISDDNADVRQLVKDALNSNITREWLMIVDNADDPEVLLNSAGEDAKTVRLIEYLPNNIRGKILFTSRSRKIAGNLTQNNKLELKDMDKTEAKQLFSRRILKQALRNDAKAVDKLLELLAYLPLAIIQAAAFIDNNDIAVDRYISLIQNTSTQVELFGERFEDPNRYQEMDSTIAKTWYISFDQIRRHDPLAAEYLCFISCIDRINIPQSLLFFNGSPVQQAKAIGTLKGYAFVTERQQVAPGSASETFFDVHRLIHMASALWLDARDERKIWMAKAADRLNKLVPYGWYENKDIWTSYLSHAIYVAGSRSTLDEEIRALLYDRVGKCQTSLGQYAAAEITHRQALSLQEKRLGEDNKLVLLSMCDIGAALSDQGKYAEAETMERQTLATQEKVLGAEHPDTLATMNILADVLDNQGKYAEAETMYRQTLATQEKVLGAEHPDTLATIHNFAGVLKRQGKYTEAEMMYRQALEMNKKVLGAEHPGMLTAVHNYAGVLKRQGKYTEAETMYRQTLTTSEKVLGAEHPDTLTTMNNLAGMLKRQGKYMEAETMYRQTLTTQEKVLGAEHPYTLTTMNNLAGLLKSQGKYTEAETMDRQTLATSEKVLGAEHPDTLTTMNNLAGLLMRQGKYAEATVLYKRTYTGLVRALGEEHPHTRACNENFTLMLTSQQQKRSADGSEGLKDGEHVRRSKESRLSRVARRLGLKSSIS